MRHSVDMAAVAPAEVAQGMVRAARQATLPLVVLDELSQRGERYGYEIMQRIGARTGHALEVGPSTLYPLLKSFRKLGLVEVFHGRESHGPVRKYYQLTPRGEEVLAEVRALHQEVARWVGPVPASGVPARSGRPELSERGSPA